MKGENRDTARDSGKDNSGQMILLTGFLIALTLVSLAVVVGSGFYSQSSPDDGGISQLTSEVSEQIETARDVGLQNIVKGNEDAIKFEGRNETEICSSLSNITKEGIRDQMTLSDDEVLLEVELIGDCDELWSGNTSYAMGQQNNSRLPGVSVNESVDEEETFDCGELRGANFTCFDEGDNKQEFNDAVVDVITDKDTDPYPDDDVIPEDYSQANNSKYNYTEDKIYALDNVSDIELDELPGDISKKEFAGCIGVDVETGDSFGCDDLRTDSNLDDPDVEEAFQNELLDVVQNKTSGDDVPGDYNQSNNSDYNYTDHKVTALENLNGTSSSEVNLSALPDEIADEPEYDSPVEGLAACVDTTIEGEKFNCTELTGSEWVDLNNTKFMSELENVVENRSDGDYLSDNKIPESPEYNESKNSAYDYTQDKLYALDNMSSVDLENDLPDVVEPGNFTECLTVSLKPGENFTCDQIRNDSGYNDGSNAADFSDELKRIVEDSSAGGTGNIPDDYNESANDKYDYEQHKIDAINNVAGIDPGDISDGITEIDRYDTKDEALANCIVVDDIGREPVDVVFSIDRTGSMGSINPPSVPPVTFNQRHKPEYTTDSGRTYTRPDPFSVEYYKEYDETGVEFESSWGESANIGADFNTSVGQVGDFVYDGSELVKVTNIPPAGPPAGIPTSWTPVTTPGVDTSDPSEYPVGAPNDCASEPCDTRTTGGTVSVGDVVIGAGSGAGNYPDSDETVEVLDDVGGVSGAPTSYTRLTETVPQKSSPDLDPFNDYAIDDAGDEFPYDTDTETFSEGAGGSVGEYVRYTDPGVPLGSDYYYMVEVVDGPEDRCFFVICDTEWEIQYDDGFTEWIDQDNLDYFRYRVDPSIDYKVGDGSGTAGYADESQLEFFEYKWDQPSPQVEVEDEFGSTRMESVSNLDYVEYEWEVPQRLYLTQLGARAALDDLVAGEDRAGLVEYSTDNSGNAEVIEGLDIMSGGHESDMKLSIDEIRPDGRTDITSGIIEARDELEMDVCEGTASREATCHIILMTDGIHNEGFPYPDSYVDGNTDYENVTIHSIALGSGSDDDVMEEIANPNGNDPVRPEGVFKSSNDPSAAKDIFEDIVGSIQDDADSTLGVSGNDSTFQLDNNATLGQDSLNFEGNESLNTSLNDIEFNESRDVNSTNESDSFDTTISASGGAIEEIYEFRMNMTRFNTTGDSENEYGIGVRDVSGSTEDVIWQMKVERNVDGVETRITFESDINDSLTRTMDNNPPDPLNTSINFDNAGSYVKMDLINEEFEVYNGSTVVYDTTDYDISAARELIDKEASGEGETGEGIAVETVDTGPDGANGTFALDLMPVNGNFSRISDGNLDFGSDNLENICEPGADDIVTCGTEDEDGGHENAAEAYASAQVKQATFEVAVETPNGGVEERQVTIDITELTR